MPYNENVFADAFNNNLTTLKSQGLDPGWTADQASMVQVVRDFFARPSFFRRITLHKTHVCKSKTKKDQPDSLYWIGLNAHEKALNFLHPKDAEKWF